MNQVFDDDGLIPVFGFGDKQTQDKAVFPFFPGAPTTSYPRHREARVLMKVAVVALA